MQPTPVVACRVQIWSSAGAYASDTCARKLQGYHGLSFVSGLSVGLGVLGARRLYSARRRARCRSSKVEPAFSFGIIADVQYADREDALNFSGSRLRRYRTSKRLWEDAVQWFRDEKVDFIAQLGDFLDGCNRASPGQGHKALQDLLAPLEGGPPTLHLVGNHELYNFPRKDMEKGIVLPQLSEPYRISAPPVLNAQAPSSTSAYYSFCPSHGWRVCVLDPYEISIMSGGGARPGIDSDAELDPLAVELCQANNPNDITKEDFARGISPGPALRWVPLNGAVSERQLRWLEDTLKEASQQNQQTILFSHVVLLPEATPRSNGLTLLWNYDKVLDIIRSAPDPPVVAMCGHAHLFVSAVDEACGTHHVTLPSPLEVDLGSDACAVVLVHQSGEIEIQGRGDFPSCRLAATARCER